MYNNNVKCREIWTVLRGTWLSVWQCSLFTHSAWDDVTSTIAGRQTAAARANPRTGLIQSLPPNCNRLLITFALYWNIRIVLRDSVWTGRSEVGPEARNASATFGGSSRIDGSLVPSHV